MLDSYFQNVMRREISRLEISMGGYLVDTCVVSELMKAQPEEHVIDWLERNSNDLQLNAITVKELYYGALHMPEGKRKNRLLSAVENVMWLYEEEILAFDQRCALICARLHDLAIRAGRTPQVEDLMIASICLRNECTLATRNVKDFEYLGVPLVNPFESDE